MPVITANTSAGGAAYCFKWYKQLFKNLTTLWLLYASSLVFFMQCGFALLEAGSVRPKNVKNIMLKNVCNTCLAALVWWAVGDAFARGTCGTHSNPIIGLQNFFFSDAAVTAEPLTYTAWLFSWVFAAVSVTIPSGSLAERCALPAYLIYTVVQTGITYPLIVHWIWSSEGWLSPFRVSCTTQQVELVFPQTVGAIDFAGSGNVHMTGGAAALVGAYLLGPRIGRFTPEGRINYMAPADPSNQVLGTMILWLGWYGFNPGSTGCMYRCMRDAAKIAVNTTLAAAAGGATSLSMEAVLGRPSDIANILNGILAGLVGITSACSVVKTYSAVVIGIVSGLILVASSIAVKKLRIDDPLDSISVHLSAGIWGMLAPGLLATQADVAEAYPNLPNPAGWGVFYGAPGNQLGLQILAIVTILVWSISINFALFGTLHCLGWLRVSKQVELDGLDHSQAIGSGVVIGCPCLT